MNGNSYICPIPPDMPMYKIPPPSNTIVLINFINPLNIFLIRINLENNARFNDEADKSITIGCIPNEMMFSLITSFTNDIPWTGGGKAPIRYIFEFFTVKLIYAIQQIEIFA